MCEVICVDVHLYVYDIECAYNNVCASVELKCMRVFAYVHV